VADDDAAEVDAFFSEDALLVEAGAGDMVGMLDEEHRAIRAVATPLIEHARVPPQLLGPLVRLRIALAGLPLEAAVKMPSELSGGMRKRAAVARALALEPEVLFLDEPTSGLDPITARAFDRLLRFLCDDLGLTILVITHDLDTLLGIVDRAIVLADGKVIAEGTVKDVMQVDDPWLQSYFRVRTMLEGTEAGRGT